MNVLRQYDESEVNSAYERIMKSILPGGLFLDGTSDPFGRVWTGSLLRRETGDLNLEALVLGANLRLDLDPEAFQTRLPKSFIHRMIPGQPIFKFMEDWKAALRDTRSHDVWGPRDWFVAAGNQMQLKGYRIARPAKWLRRGWLVWLDSNLAA
jgi:hypothetical protein